MATPDEPISSTRRTIEVVVALVLVLGFLVITAAVRWPEEAPAKLSLEGFGIIVAAGLTLVMYSFLYRDNPLFKVAENLYVGVALGYGAIITWRLSLRPEVVEPIFLAPSGGAFLYEAQRRAIPIILGVLLVTRISRKHGWMSRYPIALMVGWGAGIGISVFTHSYILQQLDAAIRPLQTVMAHAPGAAPHSVTVVTFKIIGALAVLIGTVAVLFYFFFSVEHKRAGSAFSRVGIWFLMVSFGASFGYTVMGRISLLIGRVQFLIGTWLGQPL